MACIYRPTEAVLLLRPALLLPRSALLQRRVHSSAPGSKPPPPRKSITLAGDTGQVRWSDLSPGEKAVRTTQQSFNLFVVVVGIVATGAVGFFLFADVFSPASKTAHFNRAVSLIRADPRCQSLLGPSAQIAAYGESSWSRWARNRFIHSTAETDRWGTEHLRLKFYVEGPRGHGVVQVHLVKRPSQSDFEYQELAVDVKGHQRIDLVANDKKGKVAPKIFGARWW